jgi:methyl-accepting chemotaxis protein
MIVAPHPLRQGHAYLGPQSHNHKEVNMKLSTRVWILIAAAMLGMVIIATISLFALRQTMMHERETQLATLVELAHASLQTIHEREKKGELNQEEAQKLAVQTVSSFRKGDKYFWARGFSDDVNRIHPDAKRVGVMDKNGKETGDVYRNAMKGKEIGFVLGEGSRPGVTGKVAKLYAVSKFEPWDWIVGYGAYVDDINQTFWSRAGYLLLIGVFLIAGLAVLALRLSRTILGQLGGEPQYASEIALGIAGGNLSRRIAVSGENQSLLGSMNTMQEGLRGMVGRFNQASSMLATSANELTNQMGQVSRGAKMTSEATASTAAAVEEMTVSIDHISANARETEANSRSAADLATRGEHLANEAAGEIRRISTDISSAADLIRSLVDRSREIDSMSGVIKEIADQTNLLALNAAIEAARAGEQGRGFAVVADEVRKLAERTSGATQDITRTIRAVQNDTDLAAASMDEVRNQVGVGVELAEKAAAALREIKVGANSTLEKTREVANAAQEQSQASNSIAVNIERIAQMVEDADTAVQSADAQVRQLDDLAKLLNQEAASFKL